MELNTPNPTNSTIKDMKIKLIRPGVFTTYPYWVKLMTFVLKIRKEWSFDRSCYLNQTVISYSIVLRIHRDRNSHLDF